MAGVIDANPIVGRTYKIPDQAMVSNKFFYPPPFDLAFLYDKRNQEYG